ncbi:unnamed protein product, partial [marine sediment metagenome]
MSAHMRKRHIKQNENVIRITHAGVIYQFPKKVAAKYRVTEQSVSTQKIFSSINRKYTKPGALLRGIRIRENLTQIEMAKKSRLL